MNSLIIIIKIIIIMQMVATIFNLIAYIPEPTETHSQTNKI